MKSVFSLLLIVTMLTLCGCQTVKGLGKDLEKAGEWVQDTASS